jgi:hypothetical protein
MNPVPTIRATWNPTRYRNAQAANRSLTYHYPKSQNPQIPNFPSDSRLDTLSQRSADSSAVAASVLSSRYFTIIGA